MFRTSYFRCKIKYMYVYNKLVCLPISYIGFMFRRPPALVSAAAECPLLSKARVLAVDADKRDSRFL